MVSDAEIAGMHKLIKQQGHEGEYRRSVSTRAEFPQVGIPSQVHIFVLRGERDGEEAYLWRHGNWASDQPYALVMQGSDIRTWRDAIQKLICSKIPQD